jgi:cell division protein FtsI (penicillin-binding protein 3)
MDDAATALAWRTTIRRRVLVAAAILGLWAVAIEARLVWLQVYQHDALVALSANQRKRTVDVPARRGAIVDRQGTLLAYSVDAESVYAVPAEMSDPRGTITMLCAALDRCSPDERDDLIRSVEKNRKRQFLYLRRQLWPDEAARVRALDLPGVAFVTESRRVYPNRELAAHVLGYVGVEHTGLAGIEASYDSKIRGRNGTLLVEIDAKKKAFGRVERPPTAGALVELTIDRQLQHIAERELRAAIREFRAEAGSVLIMDPWTGEVLALANEPTFNPNAYQAADEAHRRNRSVQEIYEPGSTFKVVTASAAIEERAFASDDPIDVSEGLIRIGSRVVRDVHQYGTLSFEDVIVKSSNVGAIKIGARLGNERLGRYVNRFGFGKRLCQDLHGESQGMLSAPSTWSASALASISMGYEVGVTPMQMVAAVSSVANGGALIQPRVVRAQQRNGIRTEVEPLTLRRTIDTATADGVRTIMEQVVERGTGRQAQVPGYTVAGKTGTAAKIVNRAYSKSDYYASFVGFAPSRKAAITVLVVIDTPRGGKYYGGDVAAPVFRRVAEQALRHLGVAPTLDGVPPVLVAGTALGGIPGTIRPAAAQDVPEEPGVDVSTGPPVLPDLKGLSAREAIRRLARLGLAAHVSGDGLVVDQLPPAGTPIEERSTCVLRLSRVTPAPAAQRP